MPPPFGLGFSTPPSFFFFSSFLSLSLLSGFKRTNGRSTSLSPSGHRFVLLLLFLFLKEEQKPALEGPTDAYPGKAWLLRKTGEGVA
jgi:hypothetical protein